MVTKEKSRNLLNKCMIETGLPSSQPGCRVAQSVVLPAAETCAASFKAFNDTVQPSSPLFVENICNNNNGRLHALSAYSVIHPTLSALQALTFKFHNDSMV